jgi:hypothetical protein
VPKYDYLYILERRRKLTYQQTKTHFLQINDDDFGQACENFVFVDSLTYKYTAPDVTGDKFEASSPGSPFKGKNIAECSTLLKRLAEQTGAWVLDTVFAVFDDQSSQDGSILLAQTVDDKLEGMRIMPGLACAKLLQYMIGDASIVEDREDAQEEDDGVFRMHDEFLDV